MRHNNGDVFENRPVFLNERTNLLEIEGDDEDASNYSAIALGCPNEKILECVNEFRDMLSKKIRGNM